MITSECDQNFAIRIEPVNFLIFVAIGTVKVFTSSRQRHQRICICG